MNSTEVRLNLGSRNMAIQEFTGMDCDPHQGVDIIGDISDLSRFANQEVSEIYASHCLEHVSHHKTMGVLKEWCRVLRPSGILYVAVPDFERVVELYGQVGITRWLQEYVSGGQEYSTAYHYAIFDEKKLRDLLLGAGFSEASRVVLFPIHAANDCSTKVSTFDGKPISLNMIAIK